MAIQTSNPAISVEIIGIDCRNSTKRRVATSRKWFAARDQCRAGSCPAVSTRDSSSAVSPRWMSPRWKSGRDRRLPMLNTIGRSPQPRSAVTVSCDLGRKAKSLRVGTADRSEPRHRVADRRPVNR